ncbi:MAG: peptidylprolyl isomerase [Elusimicrobiota bacterium]
MKIFLALALFLPCACRAKNPLVAKVGPLAITRSEFERKLSEVAPPYRKYIDTQAGRRQFLDVLIREKLILAAAKASGAAKSSEFKGQMRAIQAEESRRLSEEKNYLLTQTWLDELKKRGITHVSDEDVRNYYQKHPDQVWMRSILVADPDEAADLLKKLRRGANFSQLARKYSIDSATAGNGGQMQPMIYGEIIPELADVVFSMRVGELSGPIKTKFGYHVLLKEKQVRAPFNQIKSQIRSVIQKTKIDAYLRTIQSRFPVEVFNEELN